jgi:hypothetical protein
MLLFYTGGIAMKSFFQSEAGKTLLSFAVSIGLSLTIIVPVIIIDLISRIFQE